jgi:cell division protein FtsB
MPPTAPSPAVATGRLALDRDATERRSRRRRARLTARATILCSLVIGVLVLSVAPAQLYFDQRAELAQLERRAAALERTNDTLSSRAAQLRDHAYLERLARRCLGMVKPGEVAFVVVPKEGAPAPPPEC